MKNRVFQTILWVIMFVPGILVAQNDKVSSFFTKYSEQEGFTSIEVTKGLFELFAEIDADDPEFDDFQKAVSGLESLRLIAYSTQDGSKEIKDKFLADIKSSIPFGEYKELMVVKDKDANVNFYGKNEAQVVTEMIMKVDGPEEAVLLYLQGNIDLNHIAKVGKSMNLEGISRLGLMKPGK